MIKTSQHPLKPYQTNQVCKADKASQTHCHRQCVLTENNSRNFQSTKKDGKIAGSL